MARKCLRCNRRQQPRECSKKHALSLFEGSVQSCPEPCRRECRLAYYVLEGASFVLARSRRALLAWLIPQGDPFVFDARSVLSVREHDQRARTPPCLVHPERWANCFQHSQYGDLLTVGTPYNAKGFVEEQEKVPIFC